MEHARMKTRITPQIICASAAVALAALNTAATADSFAQDRKAILALAGDFKVVFDFRETLTLAPDSKPSEAHHSEAWERVILLADDGEFISFQHLLLVGEGEDPQVVKHWRQEWRYQDTEILDYQGHNTWKPRKLTKREAAGTWSQTVYQVDDSPRYEGYGVWRHLPDYSAWESNETWRPLPRREEKRHDYDVLAGRNRHAVTPTGWTHEQDNAKLALRGERPQVIAREIGVNTYTRLSGADFSPVAAYWEKNAAFWELVRKAWDDQLPHRNEVMHIKEDGGRPLWRDLAVLAKRVEKGEVALGDAADAAVRATLMASVEIRPDSVRP